MDENEFTKTALWTKRIQDFHESSLSRKEQCQKHQIPLSSFSYWIRKQTKGQLKPEQPEEPVFAWLPSKQEISSDLSAGDAPITIYQLFYRSTYTGCNPQPDVFRFIFLSRSSHPLLYLLPPESSPFAEYTRGNPESPSALTASGFPCNRSCR